MRWGLSLLGAGLLAGLVWVFGPLWPPLEAEIPRLVAIQAVLLTWALGNVVADARLRGRAAALTQGLAPAGEERSAVGRSLGDALALLPRVGRRRALLELPWYAIIGPPGAGKTTALLHAGLTFTLPEQLGRAAIAGVGGTRLCDWWFTDEAVLIDTAGRYTTQDSDAAVDRAGWLGFLDLLKRTRPAQPLNGVIVAIALPDILQGEGPAHAAAIARRVAELQDRFGVKLPVYALFTKADLIAGFSEFFDDLDADGRAQVFGETFKLGEGAARVPGAFAALSETVGARMLPRVLAERRVERRGAIAGFPTQFAQLARPLAEFATAAFPATTMLRGIYFTSGTQEGTPIDRLTGAMGRLFGLAPAPSAARTEAGRSYFLGRLLRGVVFNEAMLVPAPPGVARRRAWVRGAGFATLVLATVAGLGGVWQVAHRAEAQVASVSQALDAYRGLGTERVADGELGPLGLALDQARDLAKAVPEVPPGGAVAPGFGQGAKLRAGVEAAYRNALVNGLLPRLLWRLEAEMRGAFARPDALYEATRVYLMLGGAGPLEPAAIRDWFERSTADEETGHVAEHLDRLLAEPLPQAALDGPLVVAAREVFQRVPAAVRVYASLRATGAALPVWRPAEPLGLAGVTIFTRASGRPMTEGIPGLFTARGFATLGPALDAAIRRVAGEAWVAGRLTEMPAAEQQSLRQEVTALYWADFGKAWDAMLADLGVAPVSSIGQAAQALYIFASPESPVRALLRSMAAQLQGGPARYGPLVALASGDGAALERALRLVADVQQPLAKIAALPVGTALPPGGEDIAVALLADAVREPAPFGRWLSSLGNGALALRTGNARRQASLAYNAPGGPAGACAAAVTRYPFVAGGAALPLDEFMRVFGPGGALDGAVNTVLKPYLDTSVRPWKPAAGSPLAAADAAQFGRAAMIRDVASFRADITPRRGRLSVGGTAVEPGRSTQIAWPPAEGAPLEATLMGDASVHEEGPWALHRLVARGRLEAGRPGHLTWSLGGAVFDVALPGERASANPFAPGLFTEFRCPAVP